MTTTPISALTSTIPQTPVAPATSSSTPSSPANALGNLGSDAFLKLLVAQLQYQDPMNPADSTQLMAQTAQFTEVEKLTDLDTKMTTDLANSQNAMATSLIGDQVTMGGGPNGTDVTGVVTGMRITADGPLLLVDGQQLNLSQLQSVQSPAPAGSSATATPTATAAPTAPSTPAA